MQEMGLEPTRYCYHRHLKPARLPIPPLLRTNDIVSNFRKYVNRKNNFKKLKKLKITVDNCCIVCYYNRVADRHAADARKCRNWQTSKTKDLVIIAIVWVQVPSSALKIKGSSKRMNLFCYHYIQTKNCNQRGKQFL